MVSGLILASTGILGKLGWFLVVAVVWVVLYRAAFPRGDEEEAGEVGYQAMPDPLSLAAPVAPAPVVPASSSAPEPLVDSRPRLRCPRCAEHVLTEARLCRFCGYRFADKLGKA